MTSFGACPGAAIAPRWTTPVTSPVRSSIPDRAAITWPKSVMSTLLKVTSVGFGGFDWPGGGTMSIDVTW